MSMIWMDVDAALAKVPVNLVPLTDDTDFKSVEESVAYNAAGMELIWHFVTTAGATSATVVTPTTGGGDYDWAHQDGGMYTIGIPASGGATINNATEGFGYFTGKATGVLPWRGPTIGLRAAGTNNALIDSAYLATRGLAGTALPDAAADAAGGLPISDAGGLDLDAQIGTDIDLIASKTPDNKPTVGADGHTEADVVKISGSSTAADNAEVVFDTDFGSNYSTDNDGWVVDAEVSVGDLPGGISSWQGNLRQDTEVILAVGPFLNKNDGTPITDVSLAVADQAVLLGPAGAAAVDISSNTWAAVDSGDGNYHITLTADNLAVCGKYRLVFQDVSAYLAVHVTFDVVETAVYDFLSTERPLQSYL